MAKSYLGKISALVTANTSDFNKKLDESAQRTRSFASAVKSQINAAERAASKSLDGIYTSLQKVERALSAAGGRRLSLIDEREANRIRQLASAAEEVYRPLERAAKASEKLGADVRANFQPALIAAQKSAEALNRAIESGGTVGERSFQRIRRQVELTAESIDRLSEVQAEVGRLATGRELRFSRPSVAAALEDARASQQRLDARGAGGAARVGRIGSGEIVQRQIEAANQIEAAYSRLLAARSEQASNRFRSPGNVAAAEDALDDRVAALNRVTAELNAQQDVLDAQVSRERELADLARARAQAASRFLNVDQRESDLVSNAGLATNLDPSGRTIQQRVQDIQQLKTAEGSLRAEQEARLAVANSLLNVDQRESDLLSLSGRATGGGRVDLQQAFRDNLEREARARMGGDIPGGPGGPGGPGPGGADRETGRQVDNVIDRVARLRQQIDSLPDGIRAGLVPSLQSATDAAARLNSQGFAATADAIRSASQEADRLDASASRAERSVRFLSSVGGTAGAITLGIDDSALSGYEAQLKILQRAMIGVSDTARDDVATAFARVNTSIRDAFNAPGGITKRARQDLDAMVQSLARIVASSSGISFSRLSSELQRAGDIGRQGFDRWSLAIQQAGFAVDDFFSVTGSFDQRLRAISNNVTQLAFILGGTTGLFIGLAAVIAGQVVVAINKWVTGGQTADDVTKSLNDSLARQKSLVESLAEAFQSLGDSVTSNLFSDEGRSRRGIEDNIRDIRDRQKAARDERILSANPEVRRERARQATLRRQLEQADDFTTRAGVQAQIDASARRERRASGAAVVPPPDAREVENTLRRRAPNPFRNPAPLPEGQDVDAIRARRQALEAPLARLEEIVTDTSRFDLSIVRESYEQLRSLAERLDAALIDAADNIANSVIEASLVPAEIIERGQASVKQAIDAGIAGAVGAQASLERLGDLLRSAYNNLERAAEESDPARRQELVTQAQADVNSVREKIAATEGEVQALDAARRSLEAFAGQLERARQAADQTVSAAESEVQRAEREVASRPSPATRRELAQAQRDAEAAQAQRAAVEAEAAQASERQRNDPESQRRQRRIAEIDQQLSTTGVLAAGQREGLIAERERLLEEERRRKDAGLENARRREQEFSARQESARRGREIERSPAERAGRELAQNLNDLQNAFESRPAAERDGEALASDRRRVIDEALRSTAPAIFGLADQVQNAVLQGPSRAALQASDVTTAQGAAELNRLLRGDDSARNQDLVELQKQSNSLEELVRIARENGAPPGVLDL